jgi:hypothetical protein
MSHFDSIEIPGKGFIVSTETSSGYSGSDRKDLEKLRFWRKMTEPTMRRAFKAVESELASIAKGSNAPRLIEDQPDGSAGKIETVWEEGMDGLDVPAHLKNGNGPCIYRMRLWPKTLSMKVDVQLFVASIPSVEVRNGWKDGLLAALEREVKPDRG